ncbi:ABC transporter ATP-binding protein [Isobaculum melis]|uniref:Putative ABC transport system ATP-binding protein n=1 Tax=Isobaculum melis TaxID=142588 RepID=A0A1H9PM94_9LACT|nr:ABC transporter ATP-binding protein [Isobaculum melis]SER49332.1 putative ABC transport system ATP-binding protein [Isobaculum melis]
MSFIQIENLKKEYKTGDQITTALKNISFNVEKGSFTIILGPSGSGKSTTLNAIGGMDHMTAGKVIVDSEDIANLSSTQLTDYRRSEVGFVFQFYNLIPSLNVLENIDIVRKMSKSSISSETILEEVGLAQRKHHFPSELSGGELQRVSIARAICKDPKILLCDEPTGALDTETGRKVLQLLQSMARLHNKTVVIVTHNSSIAQAADRIIHIKDGIVEKVTNNPHPIGIDKVVW